MPKFTKTAIMNSFVGLLNSKSFDDITVKDIVDDCGINRNTFYYNFKDIYDLVDELLQEEINKIVEKHKPYHSWKEGLLCAADFAVKNKRAIFHLYNSDKRTQLEKYFKRVLNDVVAEFVDKESADSTLRSEDKQFIADFYGCALFGILEKWIDGGMREDFMSVIDKTGILLDSDISHAVHALEKNTNRENANSDI